MRHLEVSFIVDPVLSGDEVKSTVQTYKDMLTNEGASIVHIAEMGLRQLAYPINNRSTGVYFCIEFSSPNPTFIPKLELALKRDERIMRFLTVSLDKYGVKYNEDKRNGKIGKRQRKEKQVESPVVSEPYVRPVQHAAPAAPAAAPEIVIPEEE
jgi:small subunit ribosomal protein S6